MKMKMTIIIKEVLKEKELNDFIRFPEGLYQDVPNFIPPIRSQEVKNFSPDFNPAYEYCDARLWLALRNKKVVGRIAGIINHRYNEGREQKYARFGWLDFVEDLEVLKKLMHKVEIWALENDADLIHGPIGFTSFDPSGILVEGFDEMPTTYAHYNYPYYASMLEACGYTKDVDWVEYNLTVPEQIPERILRGAQMVEQRYNLHAIPIKNRRQLLKRTGEAFKLINRAYTGLYGFTEISKNQAKQLINSNWFILKRAYIAMIADENDKLIGFGLGFPSLSAALKKINGSMSLRGFLTLFQVLKYHHTIDLLLIAVREDFQNKGVNAMIFNEIAKKIYQNGVLEIETTKELETNLKVNQLWSKLDARQHKRSRCYVKPLKQVRKSGMPNE